MRTDRSHLLSLVALLTVGLSPNIAAQEKGLAPQCASQSASVRSLVHQLRGETTDEQIVTNSRLLQANPDSEQYQLGLAATYLQKVRESADFTYLDRASKLVNRILDRDSSNFPALRYQNEIDLQRHDFRTVAERAEMLVKMLRPTLEAGPTWATPSWN